MENGLSTGYSLFNFQPRGVMFIGPGVKVYEGMIIGEHSREKDLVLNIVKGKKLSNVRAAGSDDAINLVPPRKFSLEQALEYINDDELLEVTPKNIRMRKKILREIDRKREMNRLSKLSEG